MKKLLQIVCVLSALAWHDALAQQRTVTGRVTSAEDGTPIPGVNVIVKGSGAGTATDNEGKYTIAVQSAENVLTFSFIGLQTQEVQVGERTVIDVAMRSDATQLSEVVVVGYGTQDKRTLTSSITSISGDEIARQPVQSFDQALVGKASGVQVTVGSGLVGQAPRIRIRGTNSITSGADPLIVVDGVPMVSGDRASTLGSVAPSNSLGDINPSDIESYEILKDGAATAIYGSRASNGVILITTKSGKSGKIKINYDFQTGTNKVASRFNVLNAQQFIQINNEKFATDGIVQPQAFPGDENVDTDWQDVIFRTGNLQSHNLSLSGGGNGVSYFFSTNYTSQEGAVVNNSMERYSMRANIDFATLSWLSTGLKLGITRQLNNGLNSGSGALSGNVTNALKSFPNVPVYNPDHPTGYNISDDDRSLGRGNNLQEIASRYTNIKYVLDHNKQESDNYRVLANGYLQANIIDGLNVRTQLGADITDSEDFLTWDPFHGDGGGSTQGIVYRGATRILLWNWQNTLSFSRVLANDHSIGFVIGNEYQMSTTRYFFGQGSTFSDPSFVKYDLISGTFVTQSSGGDFIESGFESFFSRLNYDFKSRYIVSFSFRNDAISSLPKANRRGGFFGASLGWIVSDEGFFNLPVVSYLKFRGSIAEVGNTFVGAFPYVGSYGPALYGEQAGISFSNVGNSSLKWESSRKLDIGFDLRLFDNKVSLSVDYFQNDVNNMILNAPTPPSAGLPSNQIAKNVGSMINKGLELTIDYEVLRKNTLLWNTQLNFTSNQNEITSLNNNEDIIFDYSINRVGESIGSIFAYDYRGVNPANGNPIYSKGDGTLIQGNPDDNQYYIYDPANPSDISEGAPALNAATDRKILGTSMPKFFGGVNNTLKWKNFDFELFITFSGGNKIYNATHQSGMAMEFLNNDKRILNRWTPQNTNTDVPRLSYANTSFLNPNSSRFVEDGDFVRIQNIGFGYNVPSSLLSKFAKGSISTLRAYLQVRNAWVFTKYSGADPELNFSNTTNSQFGIDNNTNPLLRTITFGLSVGL